MDDPRPSTPLERFVCPLCEMGLSDGEDLQQHMLMHAGEQASFTCDVCGKVCPDAAMFGKHLRLHTGEKPYTCSKCGKSFREKCSLTRHTRIHTGEKPFQCAVCNKKFSDVGSFGRHKKTHQADRVKDHKCPYHPCEKSFTDKSSLNRHIKTHTGDRPFQCEVCNKCFTESGSYKRHIRIHTGEKRYPCRVCGRPFSEQASRARHERNVCMHSPGHLRESDEKRENDDDRKIDGETLRTLTASLHDVHSSIYNHYQALLSVCPKDKSCDLLNNNNLAISPEEQNGGSRTDINANEDQRKMEASGDANRDGLRQNGSSGMDINGNEDHHKTETSGDVCRDGLQKVPGSLFTSLKDQGKVVTADYSRLKSVIKEHMIKDTSCSIQESSSLGASEGAGSMYAEQKRPEVLLPWRQWLPWESTTHNAVLEKFRNATPKMLDWLRSLDQLNPTESAAQESLEETQMCFECGELIDDGDENRSTSGSVSPVSSGNRLKCKACQQSALSFVTEGSPRSVTEESPRSATEESPCSVTKESPCSVTEESPRSVTEESSRTVTEESSRTVTEESSRTVTEESSRTVTEESPCTVTKGSLRSVAEGSPCSITDGAVQLPPTLPSLSENGKVSAQSPPPTSRDDPEMQQLLLSAKENSHVDRVTGRRRYECEKCRKVFVDLSKLKRHIKIHLNIRDFVCLCGKQFIEASSLRRHQSVHSDVKPHNCTMCGKGFTDSSGLKKHIIKCNVQVKDAPKVMKVIDGEAKVVATAAVAKDEEVICNFMKCERDDSGEVASFSAAHELVRDGTKNGRTTTDIGNGSTMTGTSLALTRTKLTHNVPSSLDSQVQTTSHHSKDSYDSVVKPEMAALGDTSGAVFPQCSSPHECVRCGMSFQNAASLCCHICSNFHDSENAVSCGVCGKSFESEAFVERHMRNDHSGTEESLFLDSYSPETVEAVKLLSLLSNSGLQAFSRNPQHPEVLPLVSELPPVSSAELNVSQSFTTSTPLPTVFPGMSQPPPFVSSFTSESSKETREHTSTVFNDVTDRILSDEQTPCIGKMAAKNLTLKPLHVEPKPQSGTILDRRASMEHISSSCNPLKRNMSMQHTSSPVLQKKSRVSCCDVCDKEFPDVGSLKRHARLHTDQTRSFRCENCEKDFSDQGSLKRHRLRGCENVVVAAGSRKDSASGTSSAEVVAAENGFACTQCRMVFSTREGQMNHEKEHRVAPSLRCKVCRQSFPDTPRLLDHLQLHAAQRPHACDICLKGFADSGSLSKHRARGCYASRDVVLDSSKLPCSACGKIFSDQANFDQHMATHMGGAAKVKPHVCPDCGKSFAEACSLKRHTRLHTGKNLCKCLQCGRTFLENSGLKKHLERGTCQKDKKKKVVVPRCYPCDQCIKVFSKHYILVRHMKTHSGLRPFPCNTCGKAFTESSSLKRHIRQHTGERPYKCSRCRKSFSDAGVVKKHERSCHCLPVDDSYDDSASPLRPQDDDDSSDSPSRSQSPYLFSGSSFARKFANHLRATSSTSHSFHNGQHAITKSSTSRTVHHSRSSINAKQQRSSSSGVLRASKDCWRCGRSFASVELRKRHAELWHVGAWSFRCRCCWRRFSCLPYLRLHLKQEHHSRRGFCK